MCNMTGETWRSSFVKKWNDSSHQANLDLSQHVVPVTRRARKLLTTMATTWKQFRHFLTGPFQQEVGPHSCKSLFPPTQLSKLRQHLVCGGTQQPFSPSQHIKLCEHQVREGTRHHGCFPIPQRTKLQRLLAYEGTQIHRGDSSALVSLDFSTHWAVPAPCS